MAELQKEWETGTRIELPVRPISIAGTYYAGTLMDIDLTSGDLVVASDTATTQKSWGILKENTVVGATPVYVVCARQTYLQEIADGIGVTNLMMPVYAVGANTVNKAAPATKTSKLGVVIGVESGNRAWIEMGNVEVSI